MYKHNFNMISKLILENWRSHENSIFEFGKGTNVLIGSMGSGKTSAMDSICFALFGTFPLLQSKKLKLDEIIRNKPEQQSKAKVSLELTINDEKYTIKRVIEFKKGTTVSEFWKNDTLLEGPQNERTTEKICSVLKMNYDLFSRAVYAEQNNIEYFLEIPKSQRKLKIDELLKISKFENARKNLNVLVSRINDKIRDIQKYSEKEQHLNEIPSIENEILMKKNKNDEISKILVNKKLGKKTAEEKWKDENEKKKKFNEIDSLKKQMLGKKELINSKLSGYPVPIEKEEAIEIMLIGLMEKKKQVKEKQELKNEFDRKKQKAEAIIQKNDEQIREYSKKLSEFGAVIAVEGMDKDIERQIDLFGKAIEEIKSDKKSIELQKKEILENINSISGYDKCPTCETILDEEKKKHVCESKKQKVSEIEKIVLQRVNEINELDKKRNELKINLEKIRNELKKLQEKKWIEENLKAVEKQQLENILIKDDCEKKLSSLKIDDNLEDIIEKINVLEKKKEYFDYKKQLDVINEKAQQYEKSLSEINYDEKIEKESFEEFKKIEKEEAVFETELKNLIEIISEKTKRLNELLEMKKIIEENKKEMEKFENAVSNFEILETVLRGAQSKLREEFADTTNSALADVWAKIYPYGDYVDLKLGIDEQGDYILQLKTVGGKWINVEGITSGGERSIAALALRISFSLVLAQNLSWLVLDEPTHNLDKQAISELAITLKEHLPEIVDQIFIITHEPLLEEAASSYLYKLERQKEKDEPTRVIVERK